MEQNESADASIEELRQRYREEQQKRLRPEGMAQWRELGEELDRDPFVEPGFTRDPVVEDTTVVVVGGGFAGMLTAIDLKKHGIDDIRIVEKAGDFGGTWYWNRYPGCMCDVESYVVSAPPRRDGFHADGALRQRAGDLRVLQVAGPHIRPLSAGALPDRRHGRRVGRRGVALAGQHQPGRSALDPFPGPGRWHPAQGQTAGNPRDRRLRG